MINNIMAGKSGTADQAPTGKSAVDRNSDSAKGFSDTLSGLGREQSPSRREGAVEKGENSGQDRAASAEERLLGEGGGNAGRMARRPMIQISYGSLHGATAQTGAQAGAQIGSKELEAGKPEERRLTPAEAKLRDALLAARAAAQRVDETSVEGGPDGDAGPADVDSAIRGLGNVLRNAVDSAGRGSRDVVRGAADSVGRGLKEVVRGAADSVGRGLRDVVRGATDSVGREAGDAVRQTAGDSDPAIPDADILSADDQKVSEVMSLLNGNEKTIDEIGAVVMPQIAAGADAKRGKEVVDRARLSSGDPATVSRRVDLTSGSGEADVAMPTEADADMRETRQFRFTSARDAKQSIGMSIESGGRGERSTAEFRQTGGGENITVLDSRRFIGLAPNSNSANLTAMLSGDRDWAAAMHPSSALSNAAANSSTGGVVHTLKLQMNPHDLGSVTATLRLQGEQLTVHLTVENRVAYRQMSDDGGGILESLRAQGFSVDQVTVSIAASSDSDTANRQPGQSGQQSAADGGRQGFSAGRGQDSSQGQGQANGQGSGQGQAGKRQASDHDATTANDAASDTNPASGPRNARPSQLYL